MSGMESFYSSVLAASAPVVNPFKKVIYVDPQEGHASFNGLSPEKAKATMATAVAACDDGDTILLTGDISEHLVVDDWEAGPNEITVRGAGCGLTQPTWVQVNHDSDLIHLQVHGWTIENIRFRGPKNHALIRLDMPTTAGGAYGTTIRNCWLRRPGDGNENTMGIRLSTPFDCHIINNDFMIGGTASEPFAIGRGPGFACPNGITIMGNRFQECTNQIALTLNNSMILYNTFQGTGHTMTTVIHCNVNMSGGGNDNVVFGNSFGGDYTTDNDSYKAGAGDNWVGNYAEDVVACPSGMTLGIPTPG